jgi:hypothetical protein
MEDTRRFIEICHKHDILVGTYTQLGTFWNETFPDEHPNAMDYCQRDQFGQTSMYSEFYFSYHRSRICATSEKFLSYLKEVVRYSVESVGTDMVYFDNLGQNPCYCDRCKKAFPEFIAKRYPSEKQRVEKFGFSRLSAIQIPSGAYWRPIHCMNTISDPLVQEWIEFRCQQLYDNLADMNEFLTTLSRKVPMTVNPPILYGDNAAMAYGTDWLRIMKTTRMTFAEDGNVTQVTDDGRLISQHRCYKTARVRHNSMLRFHTPWVFRDAIEPELIALSESAVFNDGNLGVVKSYASIRKPLRPEQKQYLKYFQSHCGDYVGVEQISEVAVYKNFESLTWSWLEVWPQLTIVEQLLIQSGTQFSYVVNDELDDLSKFKTVVIPEMQCLSTQQAEKIAAFVDQGGGLLVTGQSGSRDLCYRRYELNLLATLLGREFENISATTFVAVGVGAGGDKKNDAKYTKQFGQRWQWGKGSVCWMPQAMMAHPLDPKESEQMHTMIHGNNFWDIPENWREILEGLDWTLGDGRWVAMDTPSTVVPQVSKPADKDRLLLHLINYDPNKKIENMTITVSHDLIKPEKALWRTPQEQDPIELKLSVGSNGTQLKLPAWDFHGTIILF